MTLTKDKRKQSIYMDLDAVYEIMSEARRLDRSYSWVLRKAWQIAKYEISRMEASSSFNQEVGRHDGPAQ